MLLRSWHGKHWRLKRKSSSFMGHFHIIVSSFPISAKDVCCFLPCCPKRFHGFRPPSINLPSWIWGTVSWLIQFCAISVQNSRRGWKPTVAGTLWVLFLAQVENNLEQVVPYASLSLKVQELRWGIPHKKCSAIVWAIGKFCKYLDGTHFKVYTDHHSLCFLFAMRDPQGKLARWAITLQEYDFNIVFKEGRCNADLDCLTRLVSVKSDLWASFVECEILVE